VISVNINHGEARESISSKTPNIDPSAGSDPKVRQYHVGRQQREVKDLLIDAQINLQFLEPRIHSLADPPKKRNITIRDYFQSFKITLRLCM